MFETLGFEDTTAREVAVWFALALGIAFGFLGQRSRFCFRRAVAGEATERRSAAGVWLTGLAVAILGTQALVSLGFVSFEEHRYLAADLPWLAIVLGGLAFGAGMVLTRGCISRLTVLTGTGNLRALTVLAIFAVVAHATLKGVLAPVRTALGSVTAPLGEASSLAALPGGAWVWTGLVAAAALLFAARSGARPATLAMGALIGALVPLAWVGTGYVLYDEFDPIALESLSFTLPSSETLFWAIASSSIPAGFGVGLVGGVLAGALVAALIFRDFQWQSFETPRQTGRYLAGAVLMGMGGVLAGGCTVGAGLAGTSSLGVSAFLALASIAAGGVLTSRLLGEASAASSGSAGPLATPAE
ncbi:YeeE/YedE family protein [Vannielia litorea]|uniref:Sulphur transport n=1 Tax=Vannielia litorea TaxID=1217970 RepID=A0A1N6EU36_9RHOB|nr:YeeE/YedE family protein [Vannielia litorea]SIN86589.1 Sulphur transport [Vannielia litorea]